MIKNTCYIFARGGSKGIKNKNIVKINNKPLIYYTIKEAKKSKYISRIVVSTDDIKIKKIAKKYKVEILNRPKKLASDKSPELLSWRHAIKISNKKNDLSEPFISLPTTSPLRSFKDINRAIEKYYKNNHDIIIGVTPSQRNPYLNMVKIKKNKLKLVNSLNKFYRRQDVPDVYDVTTLIYVANKKYINKCKKIIEGNVGYIIVPKERSLDIDDKHDLKIARLLLKK